jgi:hypothetical protein
MDLVNSILSQESLSKAMEGVSRTLSNKDAAAAIWQQKGGCENHCCISNGFVKKSQKQKLA